MRLVMLTGNERRHQFAATELARACELVGIVSEAKAPAFIPQETISANDRRIIGEHFAERDEAERRYFGWPFHFPRTSSLAVRSGEINAPEVTTWVDNLSPDMIVLFGTSIVRPPLLTRYDKKIVNVHLGLSPYYRGSATNFWPLVYGEPECVGATIHLAIQRVDAGDILAQVRPQAEVGDRAHDLGTRAIIEAFDLVPRVLASYADQRISPITQSLKTGRLCRRIDFNADRVRQMRTNFDSGMMAEYLAQGTQRRARRPIVEFESVLA